MARQQRRGLSWNLFILQLAAAATTTRDRHEKGSGAVGGNLTGPAAAAAAG
jgi:hypothetical protein